LHFNNINDAEPIPCTPLPDSLLAKILPNIILPSASWGFKIAAFQQVSVLKFCKHFFSVDLHAQPIVTPHIPLF
jgi:hypothetical protein